MQREPVVFSDLKAEPVEWLWQQHLPKGMICVVAGRPDQGKGLFSCRVAADVSVGCNGRPPGNVLFSAAEDDPARMTRPRLEAAGADLTRILAWPFRLPAQMGQLKARIEANKIRLVVMDPLASHLSGGVSRHSDNIRRVTDPMVEISEEFGVTWLIIEHALKRVSKYADPIAMIGGSGSGLPAAARAAYMFGKDPKDTDRRLLCPVKLNIAEWPQTLVYEVDVNELETTVAPFLLPQGKTNEHASILLQTSTKDQVPGRPPSKRSSASEWLAMYLLDTRKCKPTKAGLVLEDAQQAGQSKKTVKRAADEMGIVRKPPGGGRNCTWELPKQLKVRLLAAKKKEAAARGKAKA